ncbi:MAG: phosphatidylserine/phosphatidylglycerophosphate/cardiolipin synthase family protein [Bdellovibrionota bacterium]
MSYWETEDLFFDGDEYFDRLIKDIESAQHSITVEVYIFNDDLLGRKLAAHLVAAQIRGVKVQVIVDGVGSYNFYERLSGVLEKKGIQVKTYNPLPFLHPFYGKVNFTRKMEIYLLRLLRLNKRNHRKIVTIDDHIMYTGSFNFTAEHTSFHHSGPWKDVGIRVSGEMVKYAVLNFKRNWRLRDYYKYKKQLKKLPRSNWRQSPLRMNHTLSMKRYFYKNFLNRIHRAQKRIWFVTPYFIPRRRIIRLLGQAAERGVDVRLLTTLKTDVKIFRALQFFYYPYLLSKGVKVFQYSDTVLHAKNYIIDDWMTVGSTNLNHRSLIHDLEVDLVVQTEENIIEMEKHFLGLTEKLELVSLENMKGRTFADKIVTRLYFLFRYWL